MNLLVITSVDIPFGSAHSVHASLFLKGLRKNGANAFLLIPYGVKREALATSKEKYGHYDGVPFYIARRKKNIKKIFRFTDRFLGVFTTAIVVYKRTKKRKTDAVILGGITDLIRDFPLVVACKLRRVPVYLWSVEKASLSEDFRGLPGFLNKLSQKITETQLPKFITGSIVISSALKAHYQKYLPIDKILINPILVSEHMNKFRKEEHTEMLNNIRSKIKKNKFLVYSGSFDGKDGIFNLLDAFKDYVSKNPDTLFFMTGKNHSKAIMDAVKNYITKLNLNDKVKLLGFVDSNELHCYNYLADILFVCRTNSPFANHGFPWKLGEYCMTGRPIIATKVSDIENYFTDDENLFIVNPNDSGAISSKITYIYNNYPRALQIASSGKETAMEYFNYITRTQEVISFIKNVATCGQSFNSRN